jgi:hypothetical protein
VPKLPAAGTTLVTLTEMKGARPVNGFTVGLRVSPIPIVISYLVGYHERVLRRLGLGFGVGPVARGEPELDRADFEFEERTRVEEDGLRIEVEVRVRRGARRLARDRDRLPPGVDPARYESWLRGQTTLLADSLSALGGSDPFGVGTAIAAVTAAPAGDLVALTTAHAGVLDRFDAMMTMLQKATGDRADILQMVSWQRDLCERSAALAALPGTPAMRHQLQHFIDRVEARTAKLADYGALLAQLVPGLHQAAAALGAPARLNPLIAALSAPGSARTQEKAHRDMLLALQQVV